MTIFFPDLSHYDLDRGVSIEPGTVAVIVKATHGTAFVDRAYPVYQQQAVQQAAYLTAYHWLNHGGGAAQARYCWDMIGRVPVMIDAEDTSANTGYDGPLTVTDILEFVTELRQLGGISNLCYLPHWYWQDHMDSPDLTPLARASLSLVSSNYTTYSDTGPGWTGYGGLVPVQWQYTNALPYGGGTSDFNAFRGSLDQYRQLTQGGPMSQDFAGLPRPIPNAPDWMTGDIAAVDVATLLRRRMTAWQPGEPGQPGDDAASWWLVQTLERIDRNTAPGTVTLALTQDQVNTAMLVTMKDPAVQAGIADAIARHLHIS